MAKAQGMLWEDLRLLCIPLVLLVEGTIAYKAQWLESMAVAKLKYHLKQEAGKREQRLMETWVGYIERSQNSAT